MSFGTPKRDCSRIEERGGMGVEHQYYSPASPPSLGFAEGAVPPDPLGQLDEEFTSYAFSLLRGPEELEPSSSQNWQRVATDSASDRLCLASSSPSSLTAQHPRSTESLEDSAGQHSNRILIDNARYASFGSPPASLIPRYAHARPYAGSAGRAAALLRSADSAPSLSLKRAADCLEEACKRARASPPELSQHSSYDSIASEDFALGTLGLRSRSSADLSASPSCGVRGPTRPDAHSAASTPVLEIWQHASAQRAANQTGPGPTATLRPFCIVKKAEGLMTVAQLNSRIQGDLPFPPPCTSPPSVGNTPASPAECTPPHQNQTEGQAGDKALQPAIRLNGNTQVSGRGITIKQMMRSGWHM